MELYNSIGPNPKVVRMFIKEKGIEIATNKIDLMAGENRQAPYMEKNPMGQLPCLELDNGSFLSEITVICEYLEDKYPAPALIGSTPEEKAETRMWVRRIDLNICEPLAAGFRYGEGLNLFKSRIRVIPEASEGLKMLAQEKLAWLDERIAGSTWLCGDRFTLTDILLFCFIEFGKQVGQPLSDGCTHLAAWFERVSDRASADV